MSGSLNPLETAAMASIHDAPAAGAHVYGYIAFVDPATGSEYIPHTANGLGTTGAPGEVTLRFQSQAGQILDLVAGGGLWWYREAFRNPDGSVALNPANSGGVAWYYDIQLNYDKTDADPRIDDPGRALDLRALASFVYNPSQWQFIGIVGVGPTVGLNAPFDGQPFLRRATPFPDLPDPAVPR